MLPLLILLAFLLVPVLEIYLLIQVGQAIGFWPTAGLLAAQTVLGAWIIRRQGRRAWNALNETVRAGVLRERELGDAVLVMGGGMLLLLPGFLTDVLALALVLPFTRGVFRRGLAALAERRMRAAEARGHYRGAVFPPPGQGTGFPPFGGGPGSERVEPPPGPVVRGEVVQDDDPSPRA